MRKATGRNALLGVPISPSLYRPHAFYRFETKVIVKCVRVQRRLFGGNRWKLYTCLFPLYGEGNFSNNAVNNNVGKSNIRKFKPNEIIIIKIFEKEIRVPNQPNLEKSVK